MPLITRALTSDLPLVTSYVGVGRARREELVAVGLPVPDRVRLELVISTGARTSVLDRSAIAPLGLAPADAVALQFDVSLKLPADDGAPLVLELAVQEGEFSGQIYAGILGRDALANCALTIDAKGYTLAF
jgi:hypothetical protein